MKLTACYRLVANVAFMAMAAVRVLACGPYPPIIPTPEFFALPSGHKSIADYDRAENLKLWQSLTSDQIPLADIEQAVYTDTRERFCELTRCSTTKTSNRFYAYLRDAKDDELSDFLELAKEMEERWRDARSPWYYPRNRNAEQGTGDFNDIIDRCASYKGRRLADRYALQAVRALFASDRDGECLEYYYHAFTDIPADNLMKRMAQRYVAGILSFTGAHQLADPIFAAAGDVWSISNDDPVECMVRHNPDAPQLMEYIRSHASDTLFMRRTACIAESLVRKGTVRNMGDWEFLLAYVNSVYNGDDASARKNVRSALRHGFSTPELKDLARAFRMKLDASAVNSATLLDDLQWIERKTKASDSDAAREWIRILGNIVYAEWVPRLWMSGDYSTAVLLCAYVDNMNFINQFRNAAVGLDEMRYGETYSNPVDYLSLSFQLMESLTSSQLAQVHERIMESVPLYDFLRKDVRTDSDYYNELIGTLALREENYGRAVSYLSRVSRHYQRTMNIFKDGYLSGDPFNPSPSGWAEFTSFSEPWKPDVATLGLQYTEDAKLKFALKMLHFKQIMMTGRSADERGLARLMYVIGRHNSVCECWALTQYWDGAYVGHFYPALQYWDDDFADTNYRFLYDGYERIYAICAGYDRDIKAAMAMLKSDEARAKAEYLVGNLKTVIRLYGNTHTAKYLKASCDNWRQWL